MKFIFIDRSCGKDSNSGKRGKPIRSWKRALKLAKKRFPKKHYPVVVLIGNRLVNK